MKNLQYIIYYLYRQKWKTLECMHSSKTKKESDFCGQKKVILELKVKYQIKK